MQNDIQSAGRCLNLPELKRLAAESVQRKPEDVLSFVKLAEGGFNRSFVVSMRDGFQLVARVPYPALVPKELAVASEAATMSFLRMKGIPVPRVYAYSPTAHNAAGTKYMFMELVGTEGSNLGDVWDDMAENDCPRFVRSLVNLESRLFKLDLPAYGSLYYSKDLPAYTERVQIPDTPFCVGPDTSIALWSGRRSNLSVNRGPYTSPQAVMSAGANKEIAYLQAYGRPLHSFNRIRRETFDCRKQEPSEHIDTLHKYLSVAPYLVPGDDTLLRPTIRHPDLRPSNIFVSDDLETTSLIDWQHCSILPLFLQCGIPPSLADSSEADIDEDDAEAQGETLQKRQLHNVYLSETTGRNSLHYAALTHRFSTHRQNLYRQSCSPWLGDTVTLKSGLVSLEQNWSHVVGDAPCPITFTPDEGRETLRLDQEQREADLQMEDSRNMFGIGPEGWVPCERYEQIKEITVSLKEDMIKFAESDLDRARIADHWVYDDMDEDEYL